MPWSIIYQPHESTPKATNSLFAFKWYNDLSVYNVKQVGDISLPRQIADNYGALKIKLNKNGKNGNEIMCRSAFAWQQQKGFSRNDDSICFSHESDPIN